MTKKYALSYVGEFKCEDEGRKGYSEDLREPCIIEIDEEAEKIWQQELICRYAVRLHAEFNDSLSRESTKHNGSYTRHDNNEPIVCSADGYYIKDLSSDTILKYSSEPENINSTYRLFLGDIRRALAHVMLICPDHVRSLTYHGTHYEDIHDITLENLHVTFRATRTIGKTVQKVKMAFPFPIYKLSCYYYTTGENGADKKFVTFNESDFDEYVPDGSCLRNSEMIDLSERIPLSLCYVRADRGKIMVCEKQKNDKEEYYSSTLEDYAKRVQAAKEVINRKNEESKNDPSAKTYYVKPFYSDSAESRPVDIRWVRTDIDVPHVIDELYELEVEGKQDLTIIPSPDVFALKLGLSEMDYAEYDRDWISKPHLSPERTIDMFFGSALVGGKMKKGLFYYIEDKLTEKYAFWEDPGSEKGSYGMTDMMESLVQGERSDKELERPTADARIREKLNGLLETRSPDNARRFSELFEEKVIDLKPFDDTDAETIREKLYGKDENMVPNEEVVEKVHEQYVIWKNKEPKNGSAPSIPNFAILGAPGTGKTTIARGLAKVFGYDNEHLIVKSSADLKGKFVGHTRDQVFKMLEEADEQKKIVFIDEAYRLLDDKFGQEALAILLPVMSGDRKAIERPVTNSFNDAEDDTGEKGKNSPYTFKNGAPPIWFAGYEKELRTMLSENPGLYRRMTILKMPEPTASQLYESLLRKADDTLRDVFERPENKTLIKSYFGWGASWEHAEYFGNYGGVERFLDSCKVYIKSPNETVQNRKAIEKVISDKKNEIKRQYRSVLSAQKDANGKTSIFRFEVESDIDTTFDNVKGNERVINSLNEIVDMLLNREKYNEAGIFVPKGMLMYGPPGTGKTLLARAMAGELQRKYRKDQKDLRVAFIPTASTELIDPSGEPNRIKSLFAQAEDYDAAIIFIDEIDGIGCNRNSLNAQRTSLFQLMKEMDGFEERKNIFVIAATNAPDILDPALMREGRFDRHVTVLPPDRQGRIDILKLYLSKLSACKLCDREDLVEDIAKELAKKTMGFTPAKLKSLVNEAALLFERWEPGKTAPYDRQGDTEEDRFRKDLMEMIKRGLMGEVRTGGKKEDNFTVDRNEGWSATAIHEVGHALTGRLLGREISEITVIPRGMVNGYVAHVPDTVRITKRQLRHEIMISLGGLAAEQLFYGDDFSAGAFEDIRMATKRAYDMVTKYGMSDDIGPMALMSEGSGYLGERGGFDCSDAFRERVDDAVRKLLNECLSTVHGMLSAHKDAIARIAEILFEEETMDTAAFNKTCEKNNI